MDGSDEGDRENWGVIWDSVTSSSAVSSSSPNGEDRDDRAGEVAKFGVSTALGVLFFSGLFPDRTRLVLALRAFGFDSLSLDGPIVPGSSSESKATPPSVERVFRGNLPVQPRWA